MKMLLAYVMAVAAAGAQAAAPVSAPAPSGRFASEVAAFAQPRVVAPAHGATTLFVGSSSIRLWDVGHSFPALDAVNRGFGGATVRDVLFHYDRVVAGVQPASVVVYVGENDVAEGAPADQVAADVLALLARLRTDMPKARIAYLSMKPTPLRWDLYPRMAAVNAAVQAKAGKSFDYLDVGAALLGPKGQPDGQFFGMDGLHMNAKGYALWNGIVDRWLKPVPPAVTPI